MKQAENPLTCFCKIPWFFPNFTHFFQIPWFFPAGNFVKKIPCFPWFVPVVGTLTPICGCVSVKENIETFEQNTPFKAQLYEAIRCTQCVSCDSSRKRRSGYTGVSSSGNATSHLKIWHARIWGDVAPPTVVTRHRRRRDTEGYKRQFPCVCLTKFKQTSEVLSCVKLWQVSCATPTVWTVLCSVTVNYYKF